MTPYRNLNGNSGVASYEVAENSIHVVFKAGNYRNYMYNAVRPSTAVVERMKTLAVQGHGLNSYISSVVKKSYAGRW